MNIDGQVDLLLNHKNGSRSKKHKQFWLWLGFFIVAFIIGTMSILVAYGHRKEIATFFSEDVKDVVVIGDVPGDETFGYETEGGSGLYIGKVTIDPFTGVIGMGSCRRGTTYSPVQNGILSEMHAFIQCPVFHPPPEVSFPPFEPHKPPRSSGMIMGDATYSYKLTLAIYEEDFYGANSHKLLEEHTTTWIDTSGWVDITGFSQSINASTNYILAAVAEVSYPVYEPVTINLGYDDTGTDRYYEEPVLSGRFPRDPWNLTESGTGRNYSIYCTYTSSPDDWLEVSSAEYHSHCGDDGVHTVWEALDGTDFWYHEVNHIHYLILDLGQTYTIKKVRGRSETGNDPTHVLIYVSDDIGNWGDSVSGAISTWQDTSDWQEVDTTDKDGRYIKIEITFTESPSNFLSWGGTPMGGYFSIFDAYGSARSPTNVFNYYFQCGNESTRIPTMIFDYYFNCGNETVRPPISIFDYWFNCSNESIRIPITVFDYYFNCSNESIRTPTLIFDYWFSCRNETTRESTEIFDYWFSCGNISEVRIPIQMFNYWFSCRNETTRESTEIFDYWFSCGNISEVRIPIQMFNYWFNCGNESSTTDKVYSPNIVFTFTFFLLFIGIILPMDIIRRRKKTK